MTTENPSPIVPVKKLVFWLAVAMSVSLFGIGQFGLVAGWLSSLCLNAGGIGLVSCLAVSEICRRYDHREIQQLHQSSTSDLLTGAANRRSFDQELGRRVTQFRRYNTQCVLLIIDADYFRTINGTWGRDVGDQVLKSMVRAMTATLRDIDLLFRIDGQRFAALLPETQADHAANVAERVRMAINELRIPAINRRIQISVSIGGAELLASENAKSWYTRADNTLFEAKQSGRNRVVFDYQSNPPIEEGGNIKTIELSQP